MAQTGSRTGAANVAVILAILAFVAMGGLIYWLQITAVPTQREVPVPEETEEEAPLLDVPVAEIESIRSEPAGYVDIEVALRNETINSFLGQRGVWIGPSDNPFLVMVDSAAYAAAPELAVEDPVHVRGEIRAMSDSILDAWEAQGAIEGEGDRAVASFAEYFLEANEIQIAAEGGQGDAGAQGGEAQGGTGAEAGAGADAGAGGN